MGKTYEFWTINPEEVTPLIQGRDLIAGDRVRITRTMTYSYELDIQDVLEMSDEEEITVKDLVEGETDLSYEDATDPEIDDDIIISIEIL